MLFCANSITTFSCCGDLDYFPGLTASYERTPFFLFFKGIHIILLLSIPRDVFAWGIDGGNWPFVFSPSFLFSFDPFRARIG